MRLVCPVGSLDFQPVPINDLRLLLLGFRFEDPLGIPDQAKSPLTNCSNIFSEPSCDSVVEFFVFHVQIAF